MPHRTTLKEVHKRRLELYNQGLNDREIAEKTGVSVGVIWRWRCKKELPTQYLIKNKKVEEVKHKLFDPLYNKGLNDQEIAKKIGVYPSTIRYWRLKKELPTQPSIKSKKVEKTRQKLYNQKLTDKEIAEKTGTNMYAIRQWRYRRKLPRNQKWGTTGNPLRRCNHCGLKAWNKKDLKKFVNAKTRLYKRQNMCICCYAKQRKKYKIKHPWTTSIRSARSRAKKQGLPFNITKEHIKELWNKCKGTCSMTGKKMTLPPSSMRNPLTMTIDRITPEKGYTKENVRLVTRWYNQAKSNYSDDLTRTMCQEVVETSLKKRFAH